MRRSPVRIRQVALIEFIKREALLRKPIRTEASRFSFMESPSSSPCLVNPPRTSFRWAVMLAVFAASLFAATPLWAAEGADAAHEPAGNLPLRLVFVLFLVLLNGFFVASEFALVAVRKTRIDQLAAEGSGAAIVVQGAINHLDRYIAATQVGITIASLLLGGVGESALHELFTPLFGWVPRTQLAWLTGSAVAIGMAYFVMTAMHVIIGELMPKSIALQSAEKVCLVIGRPILFFGKLFAPLIWLLNGTGNFLLGLMGVHSAEGHGAVHSPEELGLLVEESRKGGQLNDTEAEILHRVVKFSDLTLREVMVPRVEMQALSVEMTRGSLRAFVESRPHSRVPVYHGSPDEIIGILHLKDVLPFATKMPPGDDEVKVPLMGMVREVLRLPETMTVDKLLTKFKGGRQQIAIVIDEFGGTAGMITLGDLLEQVFGEVADEFDDELAEIRTINEHEALIAGRALIGEVNEEFATGFSQNEADTFAGLVLNELGRPAIIGDEVAINGAKIRVEGVDRLRITELRLTLPQGETVEVETD